MKKLIAILLFITAIVAVDELDANPIGKTCTQWSQWEPEVLWIAGPEGSPPTPFCQEVRSRDCLIGGQWIREYQSREAECEF